MEGPAVSSVPTARGRSRKLGLLWLTLGSLGVAFAIELVLRLEPSYDPYGWLVWGRQTLHWGLDTHGAPSWKPFTWLASTPVAVAGDAAPTLWLVLSSAAGLVALWLAYRLAARLAGALAGAVAVVAILLLRDWVLFALTGNSETFAVALALGAVDRHLAGARRFALVLGALATLTRPECGAALAVYLVWLWRNEPRARKLEAAVVVSLPTLWLLPPYLAVGRPFNAGDPVFASMLSPHNPLTVVYRGATNLIWPVAVAAVAGFLIALRRGGQDRRLALFLAAGAAMWIVATVLMAAAGFPGLRRFMIPAAAAGCVLAGGGVGWLAARVRQAMGGRAWPLPALALVAVGAACLWYASFRVRDAVRSVRQEQTRSRLVRGLHEAVNRAGGPSRVLTCGAPTVDVGYQSTLAWYLNTSSVGAVGYKPHRDVRRGPRVLFTTQPPARFGAHGRLLARAGSWSVVAVRARAACFGAGA